MIIRVGIVGLTLAIAVPIAGRADDDAIFHKVVKAGAAGAVAHVWRDDAAYQSGPEMLNALRAGSSAVTAEDIEAMIACVAQPGDEVTIIGSGPEWTAAHVVITTGKAKGCQGTMSRWALAPKPVD